MTPAQILWLLVLEVPIYTVNAKIAERLGALDVGGSITVHAFGAFYGLAASKAPPPASALCQRSPALLP